MADAQERIGQSIGDYCLVHLLGKGTFGSVYLAEHLHDRTPAAVKVLHFPLTGHNALRTFLNEARTVRLRHPHIVPILDFGLNSDDFPYLVMAYADCGSLRDRYPKECKLPHATIDTYVQQLASALQYAHDHHVIHRDIKPENMLLYRGGEADPNSDIIQLSDFGIAKISEHTSQYSQHKIVGTPVYAAPEQSQGKPCPASDQYALAVVVYEWFAGQRPFQGDLFAVMLQHRMDAPPSLSKIRPDVSPQVEQIIFKALAKTPEDRFPTITHFADALHTALQKNTELIEPLSNREIPQSFSYNTISAPSSIAPDLQKVLSEMPLAPPETSLPPQPALVPPPSANAVGTGLVEIRQSPHIAPDLQKKPPIHHRRRKLMELLCLVLWFIVVQQQATALFTTDNTHRPWTANHAIEYGFDAAHTSWNPYEQVLNTTNVTHITQLWSFRTKDDIVTSPAVANGMVYVSSFDGTLYVFDATCRHDCQPLWSFTTGGRIYSSPAVANGMVYIGSDDGKLYVFDATCRQGCQPIWSFTTLDRIASSPTVENNMVYFGSYDHKFYAFDANCRQNCQPLWSVTTGDRIYSSPAVANGMVYIGSTDDWFYAFDATCRSACQPLWSFQTGASITASPIVANGMVYIGSWDDKFYAFDATCRSACQPLWSLPTGKPVFFSPAVANGAVYIGFADNRFYAFDANCRQGCLPLWSFINREKSPVTSPPTVANGVVYIGFANGTLYAFDANCRQNCLPLWSLKVAPGTSSLSAPTLANGVIYIGATDHKFYALGLPTSS